MLGGHDFATSMVAFHSLPMDGALENFEPVFCWENRPWQISLVNWDNYVGDLLSPQLFTINDINGSVQVLVNGYMDLTNLENVDHFYNNQAGQFLDEFGILVGEDLLSDNTIFSEEFGDLVPLNVRTQNSFSVSEDRAGNTLSEACFIELTDVPVTYRDWVGNSDPIDYYRFTLKEQTLVDLQLTNLTADVDMSILDSSGSPLILLRRPGTRTERFYSHLKAGTYILGISTSSSEAFYDLVVQKFTGKNEVQPVPITLPSVSILATKNQVLENDSNNPGQFTIFRTGDLNSELVVDYAISGTAKNGFDYKSLTGQVKFQPGVRAVTVDVVPIADSLLESDETVTLSLVARNHYQLGTDYTATVTIIDVPQLIQEDRVVQGTLGADKFNFVPGYRRTVFIGNGNINYGLGERDEIDLTRFSSTSVTFNNVSTRGGGVLYNPGNVERLFDSIVLGNGQEILLEGIERIRFADKVVDLVTAPNDFYFNLQWNLHVTSIHHAWRFTTGNDKVLIGIQDTGLGFDKLNRIHEDLNAPINLSNLENIKDDFQYTSSHGTSVQSIIGARGNNGEGIVGINWNSGIIHIDVLGGNKGDLTPYEATLAMIQQARTLGKKLVINMSYGTATHGQNMHPDLEQLVSQNPDVLFVISSGNSGHLNREGLASPAILAKTYTNVIAVGAAWGTRDQYWQPTVPGTRINYSTGPFRWGSQFGEGLTVVAPSEVYALGAIWDSTAQNTSFLVVGGFNGTSAAAPHVTGVASLIWSVNPALSAFDVRHIISQTAYDVGRPGYDQEHGYGLINAEAALRRALALSLNSSFA